MSQPPDEPGLRARKKARTRAAIRGHALALFRQQGYRQTTIEQIAAAAEVSPATFFRYFPTKEDVVLQDDFDVISVGALREVPAELGPVAAFRAAASVTIAAMTEADMAAIQETLALTAQVPEIRARALDEFVRTVNEVAAALAARSGRDPADIEVRTIAGAVVGVVMSAVLPDSADTFNSGRMDDVAGMFARIDEALACLERGLPL